MTTSPLPAFCFILVLLWRMAQVTDQFSMYHNQEETFMLANVGESLTLQCFHNDSSIRTFWYKQSLGQKPKLISTLFAPDCNVNGTFHDEFNNSRFTLDTETGKNHLKITNLSTSDSAFYYCMKLISMSLEPDRIFFVSVKGSGLNVPPLVYESVSVTDQPEGSVTLNCTVHTGSCGGEHSVYWFRDSGESHPGLIYTEGGRNDQCEREENTQTHTCVYNLPMKSLNPSHTGTYYCAVAACGHIRFGEGTKLDFKFISADQRNTLVYLLDGALIFISILFVLLSVSMYRNRGQSKGCQSGCARSCPENIEVHQEVDDIHYAAVNINMPRSSRRQRNNTENECVYSSVKK